MKKTFRLLATLATVSMALVSCNKEIPADSVCNTSAGGGARVISVSFGNSTKSSLDGLQPKFTDGDKILVSNGTSKEECTVSVNGGKTEITTTLSGNLTAVYPSAAAKLNANAIEGVLVPAVQDGTFANANIAKATMTEGAEKMTFTNQTALFKVTPPAGVTSFTVTSLKADVSGARTGTAVAINTEGADAAAKLVITVTGKDGDGNAYVSLLEGVKLCDLSFEYAPDATHGAIKGIPGKDIAAAANKLYTITDSNWYGYVKIGGLKWATQNLAISASGKGNWKSAKVPGTESNVINGDYFQWAAKPGYCGSSSDSDKGLLIYNSFTSSFSFKGASSRVYNFTTEKTDKIAPIAPYYSGSVGTGYSDSYAVGGALKSNDDAASIIQGATWRMPTAVEFKALKDNTFWAWDDTDCGYYVFTPKSIDDKLNMSKIPDGYNKSNALLFFPAAGYGYQEQLRNNIYGKYCFHWTSIKESEYGKATAVTIMYNFVISPYDRCDGMSIRPVSN